MLLFLSEILGLVSLWRFMGTMAEGMAVYMKPQLCATVAASDCDPCASSCLQVSRDNWLPDGPSITAPKSCSLLPQSFLLAFKN